MTLACEDLEKEMISNPTTTKEEYKNSIIQKKIACEKALAYLESHSVSIRAAAKKFNVCRGTLNSIVNQGRPFSGSGRKPMVLTREEEKIIANRALDIVRNGQLLDTKTVKKLVDEEAEIIKINFPDRSLERINERNFIFNFMRRHDLKKYFPEDNKVRNFECDVCYKCFTYKNALVLHQKRIHYSFLKE